jgi:hypothetical protein
MSWLDSVRDLARRTFAAVPSVGYAGYASPNVYTNTQAPQKPAKGPSDDMKYLSHAFEAIPPVQLFGWNVDRIRRARDDHALGVFNVSALLADAMMVDPRIFSGLAQRIGPLVGLPLEISGAARWNGKGMSETARSECAAMFAPESTACPPGTRAAGFTATGMMGTCILQNVWLSRDDGSRIDVEVRPWPMQLSWWNEAAKRYQLFTTDGTVTVEPNDGKWIVIEPHGPRSFLRGCIRPLALLWADRSYALRDRSNASAAHGSMGIVGTLPESVSISSEEGKKFLSTLRLLQQARAGIVKAFGAQVETFEPKSLMWQIYNAIISGSNADALLILTGLNAEGVYKPISQIDGVKYDLIMTEIAAATAQYNAGLVVPWTLLNFGDESLAPRLNWLVPDPREQERLDALGRRHQSFTTAMLGYSKALGRPLNAEEDQDFVDRLAASFGVEAPKLQPKAKVTAPPAGPAGAPDAPPPTEAQDTAQVKRDANATA